MENKMLIFSFCMFFIIFLSSFVNATEVDINISVNKKIFYPSDEVDIKITVTNKESFEKQNLNLVSNLGGVCEGMGTFQEFIDLGIGEKRLFEAYQFVITNLTYSGDCEVNVYIFDNNNEIIHSSSKLFKVEGTLKEFDLYIKTCKDVVCLERTKVFVKEGYTFLDYSSSVESPSITAVLTYPDKTTKQLTLPTSVKAEQIGNYELEVMASKQGYKTINKKELFGVIKEEAVIKPKEFKEDKYAL